MSKYFIAVMALFSVFCVYADPGEIEVIGIIPGVSTRDEVKNKEEGFSQYVIGGYEMFCTSEYTENVLSIFTCLFGESVRTVDRTASIARPATNYEVYKTLVDGFGKKFGAPAESSDFKVQNGFGIEGTNTVAKWIDDKGNILVLMSVGPKIGQGALVMESNEHHKLSMPDEQKRNF